LPDRFYEEDIEVEGNSIHCSRKAFEQMHLEYYKGMGWGKNGIPAEPTLLELGIADLVPNRYVSAN